MATSSAAVPPAVYGVATRLMGEFSGLFTAGTVLRCVEACADDVSFASGPAARDLTERLARDRLQQLIDLDLALALGRLSATP